MTKFDIASIARRVEALADASFLVLALFGIELALLIRQPTENENKATKSFDRERQRESSQIVPDNFALFLFDGVALRLPLLLALVGHKDRVYNCKTTIKKQRSKTKIKNKDQKQKIKNKRSTTADGGVTFAQLACCGFGLLAHALTIDRNEKLSKKEVKKKTQTNDNLLELASHSVERRRRRRRVANSDRTHCRRQTAANAATIDEREQSQIETTNKKERTSHRACRRIA